MGYLYVCLFSTGVVKVGRSEFPDFRLDQHDRRVACVGVSRERTHVVACRGHLATAEAALIERCREAAGDGNTEWFPGLDFTRTCAWADEIAARDYPEPVRARRSEKPENEALNRAISIAGGLTALARKLTARGHDVKSHATVSQWRINGVPADYCPDIEDLTGVPCEELRPAPNWAVLRRNSNASQEARR